MPQATTLLIVQLKWLVRQCRGSVFVQSVERDRRETQSHSDLYRQNPLDLQRIRRLIHWLVEKTPASDRLRSISI